MLTQSIAHTVENFLWNQPTMTPNGYAYEFIDQHTLVHRGYYYLRFFHKVRDEKICEKDVQYYLSQYRKFLILKVW